MLMVNANLNPTPDDEYLFAKLKRLLKEFSYRLLKSRKKDAAIKGEPYELVGPDDETIIRCRLAKIERIARDLTDKE